MISAAAEMDLDVASDVLSLVQELEEVPSEIKMDDNEADGGIASKVRSRKRNLSHSRVKDSVREGPEELFLDYYVSDDFEIFKLPPKKRKSAAWISRMPEELQDGTIPPPHTPEELEDGTILPPNLSEELQDGTVPPPNTPEELEDGTIHPRSISEELEKGVILPPNIPEELVDGTMLPPDMPDNLKCMIYAMNGTRLLLVVQKPLTTTDVKEHQNRLQIPFNQISDESYDFLTNDEKDFLDCRDEKRHWNCIKTPLLDLQLDSWNIPLRKWVMNKKSGDVTEVYVLNSPWIEIVRKNGLKAGDDIQVWSFRVGDQLHLALVKVDDD